MKTEETLYEILGIPEGATTDQITERYRILAREVHPDLNPTHHDIGTFVKIRRAYETLKDKSRREEYDRTIGIYHSKQKATTFLRETSHKIIRSKLEGLDDIDEDEDNSPLPQTIKDAQKPQNLIHQLLNLIVPSKKIEEENNNLKSAPTPFQRKRIYQFSVNHLESIIGAERIIVLEEQLGSQNSIKIKIPPGTNQNSTLKILHPKRGTIPIKILFHSHPNIIRNALDITLLIPFCGEEMEQEHQLKVLTCQGEILLTLLPAKTLTTRIKAHGLEDSATGSKGDFFIKVINGNEKAPTERIKILNLLEPLFRTNT